MSAPTKKMSEPSTKSHTAERRMVGPPTWFGFGWFGFGFGFKLG